MEIASEAPPPASGGERRDIVAGRLIEWTGGDLFAAIGWFIGLFIAGQVATIPFLVIYGDTSNEFFASAFIFGALVELGIVAVAANYSFRRYGGSFERLGFGPVEGSTLLWALGAFVGALALASAYSVVVQVFGLDFLKTECAEQVPKEVRDERMLLALASLVVIVFAPVCEEIFFRGFMFTGLARLWGLVPGIIASGMLFSAAHVSYKSFIPIALVGMVFAFTYSRSRNIVSTMLAHCAFNSLSIALIAGGSCDAESNAIFGALHVVAALVPGGSWR